jgi:competence protein ComEC
MIDRISICTERDSNRLKRFAHRLFKPWKARNSNDQSEILFSTTFQVIFPGDSSKAQEKYWREQAPAYTKGLILGHHGSSTSTSKELLKQMPSLKWAVASARFRRYGHPHWKVAELLKKHRIPLLKTEDWGHLHFLKSSN